MALTFFGAQANFFGQISSIWIWQKVSLLLDWDYSLCPILSKSHHVVSGFSIVFKISKIQAEILVAQASYLGGWVRGIGETPLPHRQTSKKTSVASPSDRNFLPVPTDVLVQEHVLSSLSSSRPWTNWQWLCTPSLNHSPPCFNNWRLMSVEFLKNNGSVKMANSWLLRN